MTWVARVVFSTSMVWSLGCYSMSSQSYDQLARATDTENDRSRERALETFKGQGFSLTESQLDRALLDTNDVGAQRCLRRRIAGGISTKGESTGDQVEPLALRITPIQRGTTSLSGPFTLTAPAAAGCEFLEGRENELRVTAANGASQDLEKWPAGAELARSKTGEEILYVLVADIEERQVTVQTTCNEMPSPDPISWERGSPTVTVALRPVPARKIEIHYRRVDLDRKCTHVEE